MVGLGAVKNYITFSVAFFNGLVLILLFISHEKLKIKFELFKKTT